MANVPMPPEPPKISILRRDERKYSTCEHSQPHVSYFVKVMQ